jgi:N-methylhydantoinase B
MPEEQLTIDRSRTERVILRSVIANRLDSISREMGLVLERSARSPIFAEACDFACCICNHDGELVSQLSGIPILATAGSFSVRAVLDRYGRQGIFDGDVFIVNDPYYGGNHLPDIGIITPVFAEGRLAFFCVSRAHHGDIGGSTAGSYNAKATEIFQEGLRIPPTRLVSQGRLIDEVMELIAYNTRNPEMLKSDFLAQIGANRIGSGRLKELMAARSLDVVQQYVAEILAQAETLTRQKISSLPDGVYEGTELVDDDGFQSEPIRIVARVTINGSDLTVDFTGTDEQVKGFVNTSIVTTTAAAGIAALWMLGGEIPRNGGAFRTIKVDAPYGSLVNPRPPAPVTLCTLTPAGEIISAISQAGARRVRTLLRPLILRGGSAHGTVLRRFCLLRPRFGRGDGWDGRKLLHGAHVQLWRGQNA